MTEILKTAEEMRKLDQYTMDHIGMPESVLIERAAVAVLEVIGAKQYDLTHVVVLAGLGNNGADGIAVARLLYLKGVNVTLQMTGNAFKAKESVQEQLKIAENYGLVRTEKTDFNSATLIIDAIFGTGLNNTLPEGLQKMLKAANYIAKPVLSIDVPTGLDATTGYIHGVAINAETTVTFSYKKTGFYRLRGPLVTGNIIVKNIGVYDFIGE